MAVKLFRDIYVKYSNLAEEVPFQSSKKSFIERCFLSTLRYAIQPHNVSVVLDLTQEDFDRKVSPDEVVDTDVNIAWRILSLASKLGSSGATVQLLQRFPPRNRSEMQEIYRRLGGALTNCLEYCEQLTSAGVQLRFFGDLEKLPKEIQMLMADIEAKTISNSGTVVNVTLGGAATHSAAATISALSDALVTDRLRSEDLTTEFLKTALARSSPGSPDIFIKSSDIVSTYRALSQYLPMRLLLNSTVYKLFIRDHLPDLAFWTYIKALLLHQQQEIQDSKGACNSGLSGDPDAQRNVLSEIRRNEFQSFRTHSRQQGLKGMSLPPPKCLPLEDKAHQGPLIPTPKVSTFKKS